MIEVMIFFIAEEKGHQRCGKCASCQRNPGWLQSFKANEISVTH